MAGRAFDADYCDARTLNAVLPEGYAALADRYVWIHEPDAEGRTRVVQPDAFVVDDGQTKAGSSGATVAAPQQVVLPATRREGNKYLKILDSKSRRLITVIELLSPANKRPGPDREAYLTKRIDYLTAGVNLVEIDLLRAGQRIPIGEPLPQGFDYYALVCRVREMPKAGVWPFTMRDSIPIIPVPLAGSDSDISLDLRLALTWRMSRAVMSETLITPSRRSRRSHPPISNGRIGCTETIERRVAWLGDSGCVIGGIALGGQMLTRRAPRLTTQRATASVCAVFQTATWCMWSRPPTDNCSLAEK